MKFICRYGCFTQDEEFCIETLAVESDSEEKISRYIYEENLLSPDASPFCEITPFNRKIEQHRKVLAEQDNIFWEI